MFLRQNRWVFNNRSMGTETQWNPALHPNILLIGNSIVAGGNPLDQKDKLCPLIQKAMGPGYSIWPIAVGGWTNLNETAYLQRNPDVEASANFFVWEYMVGGTSKLAPWSSDYGFPRKRPLWASWYIFRRYILARFIPIPSELPPTGPATVTGMQMFRNEIGRISAATGRRTPGLLFLYPQRNQFLAARSGIEWLPERAQIEEIARTQNLKIVDVTRSPQWRTDLYRDGETHPNEEGDAILATILAGSIEQVLSCEAVARTTNDSLYLPLSPSALAQGGCRADSQNRLTNEVVGRH
ncbi:MAG: SGNH/GDSL hydrolase family protein [Terracidiphilus sp.]|jgi:hypothetical protein